MAIWTSSQSVFYANAFKRNLINLCICKGLSKYVFQITLPRGPPHQPIWNHSFFFCNEREKATLFTPNAALVLEYFSQNSGEFIKLEQGFHL